MLPKIVVFWLGEKAEGMELQPAQLVVLLLVEVVEVGWRSSRGWWWWI